ncbi:MAG: trigger factor [Pirellulales bacterium]
MAAEDQEELVDDIPKDVDGPKDSDEGDGDADAEKLNLSVQVSSPSACQKHVTVSVSREDIDRYLDDAYSELMTTSDVPGFRKGRAPRKLVESRYKKEIAEQIKGSLLMDCLGQVSEEEKFAAISEPDINLDAVEVPDEGPMTFEFDLEVRPEFEMPKWQGLKLNRPIRDFTDKDVDCELEKMLSRYGQLTPHNGPAEIGDYLSVSITGSHQGKQVSHEEDHLLRIRPMLSFSDGRLDNFGELATGAEPGTRFSGKVELVQDATNKALSGETVDIEFNVLEVKKLNLPELTADFLQEMGDFETEGDLREAIQANLKRQLQYQQQQQVRQQISAELTKTADFDLPPELLKRQSSRELERAIMELRRSGFGESDIRAHENELRQNSAQSTERALKEHFILERIAEDEDIEAAEGDFEQEVFLMAAQSGESPRRVRAQIEKRGLMDVLQNQIVERKVLELVQAKAKFEDEAYEVDGQTEVEAIPLAAGGGEGSADIHDASGDSGANEKSDDVSEKDEASTVASAD